jgi:hypothetical protein
MGDLEMIRPMLKSVECAMATAFALFTPGARSCSRLESMVLCVPASLPRGSIGHDSVPAAEI